MYRAEVFSLIVNDGDRRLAVKAHLFERLPYRAVDGDIFNQAFRYDKAENIHSLPSFSWDIPAGAGGW